MKHTGKFLLLFLFSAVFSLFCMTLRVNAEEAETEKITEEVSIDNGIPVIYLNIDESRGTIEDMMASEDHSVYCYGTVTIDVPEGFHYSDFPDKECVSLNNLDMSIRGRGNSTWMSDGKKPFKIKLDKKTDVFGLGKNKHWVLVANDFDETLMRDRITGWLGDEMGFAFTPRGVPVDVVMSGENFGTQYLGSYYFSENVRVDDSRLEIEELEEGDTDPEIITGGYLIQNGVQTDYESPDRFFTSRGADWATHTPSFDPTDNVLLSDGTEKEESFSASEFGDGYVNKSQQEYIQNYIQEFEDILYNQGTAYRDLMDIETAAKYWLIQEISKNLDAFSTGSTYLYKDRDQNGEVSKLYWGPLWDFDFAWDYVPSPEAISIGHPWNKPMLYDTSEGGFTQEIFKQWPLMKEKLQQLIAEGGVIDQYYEETKASAEYDRRIFNPEASKTYETEVQELKTWIENRIAWADENLHELENRVHKASFYVDGELWESWYTEDGRYHNFTVKDPVKEGYFFTGWFDEDGNEINYRSEILHDYVYHAEFIPDSEVIYGQDIAFSKNNDIVAYRSWSTYYRISYTVIPENAHIQGVEWTSSDESFATVDENGLVSYEGPGTVTITAKLKNGKERSFTLTITSDPIDDPKSIDPDQKEIILNPGEQSVCPVYTVPSPVHIDNWYYASEDESVVTAGKNGVLSAVGPGTARVCIKAGCYNSEGQEVILETWVTVTVKGDEPDPEPEPQPAIEYLFANGADSTWQKGNPKDLTITVKRNIDDETCFSHFTGVKIDGALLKKNSDYKAVSGSTIITLKKSYLQKLKAGEHTVEILFDDGSAETKLIIKEAEPKGKNTKNAPDTSDHQSTGWYYVLGGSCIALIAALILRLRASKK